MDQGDSRKLSLPSGSSLTKKSMTFLRDAYSLAQNTFQTPNDQHGSNHHSGLSQHFNNAYHGPPPPPQQQQQQHLYPQSAVSQHQPQQWPRPPPSPNRPAQWQTPPPVPYMQAHPQGQPRPVSPNYIPGQGMVSVAPYSSNPPALPQRRPSNVSAPQPEDLPPPPPYPGHSAPTPPPQQASQQPNVSPLSNGTPVSQHHHVQSGWSPPASQQQTPVQVYHQQHPAWAQTQPSPLPPPPPSQPQQQYHTYSPPLQQLHHPPPPQRHPSVPNITHRPQQFQPHHSNTYPSASHQPILRPASAHGQQPSRENPPPLPNRPSPQPTPPLVAHQYQQPPTGYSELPSPPQPQQQSQYFPSPPAGIAEMYAPPPPPQPPRENFSELPGNEPSGIQQGRINAQQQGNDVKTPINQQQQGHGIGIPHLAELPA